MNNKKPSWFNIGFQIIGIFLAFLFTILILIISGSSPLETFRQIALGSFGSVKKIADVMVITIPLTIITSGLLITFMAGLWNIGIEGQITLGAIFTTWLMRLLQDTQGPPAMIILVSVLAGMIGGSLWALLVGLLRVFGGVNEIFGGLGLNFVATALTLWLIFGPWKRPGIGSMSGTVPFPEGLWLATIPGYRLSIWGLVLAFSAFLAVYFLLRDTIIGLRLKAIGKNLRCCLPGWNPCLAAHDSRIFALRLACGSGRIFAGCRFSPPPCTFHIRRVWFYGAIDCHVDQLPSILYHPNSHIFCSFEPWEYPASYCFKDGFIPGRCIARHAGVVCNYHGRNSPQDYTKK